MDILVLDTNFVAKAIVDTYESLIWTDRFNAYGDFEIYTAIDLRVLNNLKKDYYLLTQKSEHVMIIDTIQKDTDAEDGDKLIVTGRSLESILSRRIIWKQTVLTGNLQNGIKKLLDENIISPEIAERKIDNFIFEASDDPAITELNIDAQFTGDNLYDVIYSICLEYNIGFKVTLNDNNQFVFKLYAGIDRSYAQLRNPYVVFSPNFENIINSNFVSSNRNLKTITLVAGEGEGVDRKTTVVEAASGGGSGLNRREMFTDARDISTTTTDGETVPIEEYNSQLAQRGSADLSENTFIEYFDGQVDTNNTYKYGEDFFMGDIVQFADGYGNETKSRVTEFIYSHDVNGEDSYPTFSAVPEDASQTSDLAFIDDGAGNVTSISGLALTDDGAGNAENMSDLMLTDDGNGNVSEVDN